MMNTLSLCWHLLIIVGQLPEELIVKILYHYSGLKHPIANILLEHTKVDRFEELQKLPFSSSIYKFYLNQEKYKSLFSIDIVNYINNKQCSYFRECPSYIHYDNPGYFIPRQFGRLYYNVLNDFDSVETKIHVDWKLYRSKRILKSMRQNYKGKYKKLFMIKTHKYLPIHDVKNYNNFTHKLMCFEKEMTKKGPSIEN
jgi:hypothetical protein